MGALNPAHDHLAIATEGQDRPGPYCIRQGHAMPVDDFPGAVVLTDDHFAYRNVTDEKIIVMTRDPRDIAVSARHHWDMDSLEKAVCCMMHGGWPLPHGGGWVPWVRAWQYVEGAVDCWTSYEALSDEPYVELMHIFSELGLGKVPLLLRYIIERQSFATRREFTEQHGDDLNYGKEFQDRFLRKGTVGDWKNHDWGNFYDLAMEHWGELMKELGYE